MSRIVCVTSSFPTRARYWRGTFVENFCLELAGLGAEVSAIVPDGWHAVLSGRINGNRRYERRIDTIEAGYLSVSRLAARASIFSRINERFSRKSVERALDDLDFKPDLIYAHFLASGLLVRDWCERNDVRLAVISGESAYKGMLKWKNRAELVEHVKGFDHLFFVSERNRVELARFLNVDTIQGDVLGNAVDSNTFRPIPKEYSREKLGLPRDKILAVFVGYFIERKGPIRVLRALEKVDDTYGVFIGHGRATPKGERVIHVGTVPNREIPLWLSAADFFVLPSFEEGRSNAILEALACGLPVVVSDRGFNREFLSEECSIFVDPESVEDIARGMRRLAESPALRRDMSAAARQHGLQFSQREKARRFLSSVGFGIGDRNCID